MSTRKPRGIQNNNPLNLKRCCRLRKGEDPSTMLGDYCKFDALRWGWRSAFILLFDAYACGSRTRREIVHDLFPEEHGYHPEAYLRKMREVTNISWDYPLSSPEDNCSTWMILAEEICYGMNSTDDFDHINEQWIGWAMAWNECFNNPKGKAILDHE